jgi:PTS system fructose-specific IIA component
VDSKAVSKKEDFIKDIYERENRGFTYAGDYLAIPYGWSEYVIKPVIWLN